MSYKILYFTDVHLKEKNPRSRIDDYLESIMDKLMEIASMINKINPDEVICGGDFFDSARQSVYLLSIVLEFFDSIVSKHLPIEMVLGNHEWTGCIEDSLKRSALGILEGMGRIYIHRHFLLRTIEERTLITRHEQFVEKPVPWHHTLWKDYDGKADIFLVSDYHPFQGHKRVKATHRYVDFVAPGAISRATRTEEDLNRDPQVALLTIDGKDLNVKFFKLKTAKPSSEIFGESLAKAPKTVNKIAIEEAVQSLKDLRKTLELYRVEDIIAVLAKRLDANEEVVKRCLERVQR